MLVEAPLPALIEDQPYPHHLWHPHAQKHNSLLSAFAAVAGAESAETLLRELERRERTAGKKIERLQGELQKATEAEKLTRGRADVLIAYATTVTRGVSRVVLPGFDGSDVSIDLDPKLSAIDNAQVLYAEARKQERAVKRIPTLIAHAERERDRLSGLLERARRGELTDVELKEIARQPVVKPQQVISERLPYRVYHTTSGLEVRVGRNAKSNDELTLHHSSPRDIWLHARHVGGAHVVLRWNEPEANPSQRDIAEAATLAAVHSGARTSRTVPVDYTRRKYVRKPRRSPPGTVYIERAKTIFVEPSATLEEKLRG
jgi:predicted ribosome quality control (RQC) complex YloA/Tae2 family protein